MAHILIVDDLEQNLYLLEVLLKGHGYAVETAVNGTSALQKAKANPPSMIISDILMPVMDGFTLCRQWKADNQLKHIPFIFYTATYTDPQDRAFALSLGADKFLIKPLEPEQLIAVLHEIEQEQEQEPQGASPKPVVEETTYFKQYNETLIRKLEKKMMDLERANRRLQTLYQVSMKLAAIQPQKDLISQALKAVVEIVGYTYAEFFAYDAQTKIFTLQVAVGQDQETQADAACGQERNLVGLSEQQREPLIITDARIDPRWIPENIPVQSLLSVPVIYKERFIGMISFLSAKRDAFTEEDGRNAMTLANNIAVAIENARLYEEQQEYSTRLEAEVATRTAELTTALEKAQAADRLKSQFVSDVNHELRTPLSNIKLYLNLLDRGSSANRLRYLDILNRETGRLQRLIEDMLDLSRLDADKTPANLEPVDLNALIGSLVLERGGLAADNNLTLDFESNETIPPVLADQQLIFQVLTNLLINAINYTQSGDAITLHTDTTQKGGEIWVTASITDTGPGISSEDLPHLFERFYRGQAGRKSNAPGSGLGLAICQEIIERHSGLINVTSRVNGGSTFTLYLPIARA